MIVGDDRIPDRMKAVDLLPGATVKNYQKTAGTDYPGAFPDHFFLPLEVGEGTEAEDQTNGLLPKG